MLCFPSKKDYNFFIFWKLNLLKNNKENIQPGVSWYMVDEEKVMFGVNLFLFCLDFAIYAYLTRID